MTSRGVDSGNTVRVIEGSARCGVTLEEQRFEEIDRITLLSFCGGEKGQIGGEGLSAEERSAAE